MKAALISNLLIFITLGLSAQNLVNQSVAYQQNTQINYFNNTNINDNVNVVQQKKTPQAKIRTNVTNIEVNDNVGNINDQTINRNKSNNTNKKKVQSTVNINQNPVNNVQVNVADNNVNVNKDIQGNPNKIIDNKPVIKETKNEMKAGDYKWEPKYDLAGLGYNGGKIKKGQKNFYKPAKTKTKKFHKKKPAFKKKKHHTSKCAKW